MSQHVSTERISAWSSRDPLGEALHFLRLTGVAYSRCELNAPWGIDWPATSGCLVFHVVASGHAVLELPGVQPLRLQPGEFTLLPSGEPHGLRHDADGSPVEYTEVIRETVSPRYELLSNHGEGEPARIVSGTVRLDHPAARELAALLPRVILIQAWASPQADWMETTLRLLAAEASQPRPGGEEVVTRLGDILVVQAIRSWIAAHPKDQRGWLAALQDERLGPALLCIQREPEKEWSVASLASAAGLSRSAFAARFRAIVGESPMQYLTRWRMHVATSWLQEGREPLAAMSTRLGYRSEAAFSRAYKRVLGESPGAVRRRARSQPSPLASV